MIPENFTIFSFKTLILSLFLSSFFLPSPPRGRNRCTECIEWPLYPDLLRTAFTYTYLLLLLVSTQASPRIHSRDCQGIITRTRSDWPCVAHLAAPFANRRASSPYSLSLYTLLYTGFYPSVSPTHSFRANARLPSVYTLVFFSPFLPRVHAWLRGLQRNAHPSK